MKEEGDKLKNHHQQQQQLQQYHSLHTRLLTSLLPSLPPSLSLEMEDQTTSGHHEGRRGQAGNPTTNQQQQQQQQYHSIRSRLLTSLPPSLLFPLPLITSMELEDQATPGHHEGRRGQAGKPTTNQQQQQQQSNTISFTLAYSLSLPPSIPLFH